MKTTKQEATADFLTRWVPFAFPFTPDNATDTSLFCLPVQANGVDSFKVALCLISRELEGMDARIVLNMTR